MTGETGVDEARGGVGEEAEAPQRRLALKARGDVVAEGDQLVGGTQDKLAGVQDEGLIRPHVDTSRQIRLIRRRVDHRVAVIIEETKEAIQPHVNTGWLNQATVQRIETNPAGIQRDVDVAVTEQHDSIVAHSAPRQQPQRITPGDGPARRSRRHRNA